MQTAKSLEKYFVDIVAGLLGTRQFVWSRTRRCFVKSLAGLEQLIFVVVARQGSGFFTVHFPAHIRFPAVEAIRSRFKVWPAAQNEKQRDLANGASTTVVRAYPKELGAASAIEVNPASDPVRQLDAVHRILDAQMEWLKKFSDLNKVQQALESESPAEWPLPLPMQRLEVLACIYVLSGDSQSLTKLIENLRTRKKSAVSEPALAFLDQVAETLRGN